MTYIPSTPRLKRDVSELLDHPVNEYLPPISSSMEAESIPEEPAQQLVADEGTNAEVQMPESTQAPSEEPEMQDTAVFGENGYEYKTVRKLVVRSRRDVSHLQLNYLPPFEPKQPSTKYLPPVSNKLSEKSKPVQEYLPPVATKEIEEVVSATEAPQPSNEYLPPHSTEEPEEAPSTEAPEPIKEYLPPVKVESVSEAAPETKSNEELNIETTEAPAEETTVAPQKEEVMEAVTEAAQQQEETAVFADDGYHYKQPNEVPSELFAAEQEPILTPADPSPEYFPTLDEGIVEVEGPSNGESAILAEDGYHYRVIKRRV